MYYFRSKLSVLSATNQQACIKRSHKRGSVAWPKGQSQLNQQLLYSRFPILDSRFPTRSTIVRATSPVTRRTVNCQRTINVLNICFAKLTIHVVKGLINKSDIPDTSFCCHGFNHIFHNLNPTHRWTDWHT